MADLRDLGLSEYEKRVYRTLLRTGPTTAKELSEESEVPMGRIYDVLNGLEGIDLVRSQTASRPKRYAAVEPEAALDRLLAERRAELDERAEQYAAIADELGEQLEATEPVEPFWTAELGSEAAGELLVERLSTADERIVMVLGAPTHEAELGEISERAIDELERALDRGVSVSILVRPALVEALPQRVWERYRTTLRDHEACAVRTSEGVTGTFELIDRTEVCVEVPHPFDVGETFAVIALRDPEFAADIGDTFRSRWEHAEPLTL